MNPNNLTLENIQSYAGYAARGDYLYGAEDLLLRKLVTTGMKVLEIGCGTGRVTRALARLGAVVDACDLDEKALNDARSSTVGMHVSLHLADARALPFEDSYFDLVLFAFNGLDFLHPVPERLKVIAEMERVTKPGGAVVLSSHNMVGTILSPRGLRSLTSLRTRFRAIGCMLRGECYAPDMAELMLHHATPNHVISQVTEATSLRFVACANRTGKIGNLALLTLFSAWPYYHFEK